MVISRTHRFHGYGSLRRVYRQGQMTRGSLFAVKALPNESRKSYRAAVVVSRKVNKSAVARNRIRRRLYEAIWILGPQINHPYDIVITVFNDSLLEVPHRQLEGQLKRLLKQAKVIG
ncbi:MAG TPA: ribonuclease P protein component [Candidatus Saccharimonadales bacterium]|nr:ribonuclease P protein component [Candidatus Saccharimonadales bacterium]